MAPGSTLGRPVTQRAILDRIDALSSNHGTPLDLATHEVRQSERRHLWQQYRESKYGLKPTVHSKDVGIPIAELELRRNKRVRRKPSPLRVINTKSGEVRGFGSSAAFTRARTRGLA